MPRIGAAPFAFPDFRGATRRLVLANLIAYFALYSAGLGGAGSRQDQVGQVAGSSFRPIFCMGPSGSRSPTALSTLGWWGRSLNRCRSWFLAGFLEPYHGDGWVMGLYGASVLGTAAGAVLLYVGGLATGHPIGHGPFVPDASARFSECWWRSAISTEMSSS